MDSNLIKPNNPFNCIDDYIKGLVHDSEKLLYDLTRVHAERCQIIEFVTDVPEQPDPDLFIALVTRWKEVVDYFDKPLRVYTYLYNEQSEKYLVQLTSKQPNIFVTIIPGYLRRTSIL